MAVVAVVVVPVMVMRVGRPPGPGLDLDAVHRRRRGDDQRADVTADVEHDRTLAGVRVVLHGQLLSGLSLSATPVPGVLW